MPIVEDSARECFHRFRDHLRDLFAEALAPNIPLTCQTSEEDDTRATLGFRHGINFVGVPLLSDAYGPLEMYFSQELVAVGEGETFRLETRKYWYRLSTKNAPQPVIRWEYERDPGPAKPWARHHVQIHGTAPLPSGVFDLKKLHTPTGWVTIEEVLRFLFWDLGVKARCGERWQDVLTESERKFYESFTSRRHHPHPR